MIISLFQAVIIHSAKRLLWLTAIEPETLKDRTIEVKGCFSIFTLYIDYMY